MSIAGQVKAGATSRRDLWSGPKCCSSVCRCTAGRLTGLCRQACNCQEHGKETNFPLNLSSSLRLFLFTYHHGPLVLSIHSPPRPNEPALPLHFIINENRMSPTNPTGNKEAICVLPHVAIGKLIEKFDACLQNVEKMISNTFPQLRHY